MRADGPARRDTLMLGLTVATLSVFALPIFFIGDAALQRQSLDIKTNQLRETGLTLLEAERPLQAAIRTLRADTIAHHTIRPARRIEAGRALEHFADAIGTSSLAGELAPQLTALRAAWSAVPGKGRTLPAIDRTLSADLDIATAIGQRAALFGDGSSTAVPEGARLYITSFPILEDRNDQERNLIVAAASHQRVSASTPVAIDIFEAQGDREYGAAVVTARQMRSTTSHGEAIVDALRDIGYERSRFEDATDYALAHRDDLSGGATRVQERARDVSRTLDLTSTLVLSAVRDDINDAVESERTGIARTWWTAAIAWLIGAFLIVFGAIAVQLRARGFEQRERARGEVRRTEITRQLALTEARLDAIFDRATVGVAIFTANGEMMRANRALEAIVSNPEPKTIGADGELFDELLAGTIDGFTAHTTVNNHGLPRQLQSDFSVLHDRAGETRMVLAFVRDTTSQTAFEDLLRFEATHDPLTLLPNRAFLGERIATCTSPGRTSEGCHAVLYLEIDSDAAALGNSHYAGDDTIVAIASRLATSVDSTTFVARFDGNAFVVMLEDLADPDVAPRMVDRIVERLVASMAIGERELHATVRAGLTILAGPYDDPLDAVRDAELAVRGAYGRELTSVAVFAPAMRDQATRRAAIGTALRHALERNEMELHYQPVIGASNRGIRGFEALLRWTHPAMGPISPLDFIPIAEQTGLIVPIGRWVVNRACSQLGEWRALGIDVSGLSMAINASVLEIIQPGYAGAVSDAIETYRLKPANVTIEITESAVLESGKYASGSLESLEALGVGLAIDDFGTGYSSMRYLLEFPFTQLKIDGSFVRGVDGTLASEAIVSTLIALAKATKVTTVAEGVETEDQASRLVALGVDTLQGYLFSKPLPANAIAEMLRRPRLRLVKENLG